MIDVTFPYACDWGCPTNIFSESALDVELFSEINSLVKEPVKLLLNKEVLNPDFKKSHGGLYSLINEITEYSKFEEGELSRDMYNDLNAFRNYIWSLVELSDSYMTVTQGEDSGGAPGFCSGYDIFWDSNIDEASKTLNKNLSSEINALKKKIYLPIRLDERNNN